MCVNCRRDLLSFTAHKLYGPKGIGALYVRRGARGLLQPLTFGGGQERGLRPGTLADASDRGLWQRLRARGAGTAARERRACRRCASGCGRQFAQLWAALHLNGAGAARVPGILNVSFAGVEGESLVAGLTGLRVSTGSACNSDSPRALLCAARTGSQHRSSPRARLRFSLGRFSTEADVDRAARR